MEDLILIVDDARFARRIETKALQDAGFEHIVEAKTAKEAGGRKPAQAVRGLRKRLGSV